MRNSNEQSPTSTSRQNPKTSNVTGTLLTTLPAEEAKRATVNPCGLSQKRLDELTLDAREATRQILLALARPPVSPAAPTTAVKENPRELTRFGAKLKGVIDGDTLQSEDYYITARTTADEMKDLQRLGAAEKLHFQHLPRNQSGVFAIGDRIGQILSLVLHANTVLKFITNDSRNNKLPANIPSGPYVIVLYPKQQLVNVGNATFALECGLIQHP